MPSKTAEELIRKRKELEKKFEEDIAALDTTTAMQEEVKAIKAAYKNLKDLGFTSDARLFDEFEDKEKTKTTTTLKAIDKYIREELDFVRTRAKRDGVQESDAKPVAAPAKGKKEAA